MTHISDAAEALLEKVGSARQREREWLTEFDEQRKKDRLAGREAFQEEQVTLMAAALAAGVPKRRVALAYGTATFKNIPGASAAERKATALRTEALHAALGVEGAPAAVEAVSAPPVPSAGPVDPVEFDPEAVEFTYLRSEMAATNDFGVPIHIENWDVDDPSGSVYAAEVYYPQEGHEQQAEWGINLKTHEGLDFEVEMAILASTATSDLDIYQANWTTAKGDK